MNANGSIDTPLPGALDVREVLEGLLGRDVDVTTGGAMVNPTADDGAMVGIYVDNYLKLAAIVLFDLPLSARLGAAIALVPSAGAEYAIEEGALTQALFDNSSEILNIAASMFNAEGAPHLKLDRVYAPGDPLPADVAQWVLAYVRRLDLTVTIKGYGEGRVSALVI
ncbi:hypothetical protein [Pengzhenrongella frigida]|uniref:Uncharacterized protein n=1 Tax=Pengzhenrongella frigida TaxID=1259133 RepID=A0A4Q5MYN2_9MICO|nr:hypothetical protein [Cellulomonas sp. HLT2-17]RYV49347.1 hypothetical protein EUA98_19250 [Cellulomonas sp. HLT2-17]